MLTGLSGARANRYSRISCTLKRNDIPPVVIDRQELLSRIGPLVRQLTFDETYDLAVLNPSGHHFADGISRLGIDARGCLMDGLQNIVSIGAQSWL